MKRIVFLVIVGLVIPLVVSASYFSGTVKMHGARIPGAIVSIYSDLVITPASVPTSKDTTNTAGYFQVVFPDSAGVARLVITNFDPYRYNERYEVNVQPQTTSADFFPELELVGIYPGNSKYNNLPDRINDNYGFVSYYLSGGNSGSFEVAESLATLGHYVGICIKADSVGMYGYLTWSQLRQLQAMGHEIIQWQSNTGGLFYDNTDSPRPCSVIADSIETDKHLFMDSGIYPTMLGLYPAADAAATWLVMGDTLHCALVNTFQYTIFRPLPVEGGCNFSPVWDDPICVYGQHLGSKTIEDSLRADPSLNPQFIDAHNIQASFILSTSSFKTMICNRGWPRGHWWMFHLNAPTLGSTTFPILLQQLAFCDSIGISVTRPTDGARICYRGKQAYPTGTNILVNGSFTTDANRDSIPDGTEATSTYGNAYWAGHIKSGTDGPSGSLNEKWFVMYGYKGKNSTNELKFSTTGVKPGHKYQVSWKQRAWYNFKTNYDTNGVRLSSSGYDGGPIIFSQKYFPHAYYFYGAVSDSENAYTAEDSLNIWCDSLSARGEWVEVSGGSKGAYPGFIFTCPKDAMVLGIRWQTTKGYGILDSLELADIKMVEIATPEEGGFPVLQAKKAYFHEYLTVPFFASDPDSIYANTLWFNTTSRKLKFATGAHADSVKTFCWEE